MKHMDTLQKRLIAVLAVLTCIAVFMAFSMYRAIYVNPGSLNTTALSWKNRDIPADMNDVSLVYFTDLEYGRYETHERAQKVFDRIQNMNPRVLIFGGDLFDADAEVTEEMKNQMIQWLSSIPAPLGKFAVLGEQDLVSPERLDLVRQIFNASQVEVIDNSSRLICNRTTAGIRLVGISPQEDWQAALQCVQSDQYTVLVSHYTDPFASEALESAGIDYALGGNSHGTQITYPILGGYRSWPGSETVNRSETTRIGFPYYISTGTGCIKVNARLNATPEIVYILISA
ncbi:hypothetical protein [uncultured Faecalibaculum sp.]|uniref:hypothetical protein n=2 Tax=uncultured Faecalibaculum sp. TaxID=1729681 RepID=UPI00261FD1EE|nr:hypothetical protein [uncultured Faecalibaculum sp.]